jgi:hypothetical protein
LQAGLIEHCIHTCVHSDLCPVELWCADNPEHDFFRDNTQRFDIALHMQQGRDLGERMFHALEHTLEKTSYAIIVGADCPVLSNEHLHTAFEALHTEFMRPKHKEHVVLIPAEDGGYVLLGATKAVASMFNAIDWGSENVMQQTRDKLTLSGITYTELPTLWDIDRPEDLPRLKKLAVGQRLLDAVANE